MNCDQIQQRLSAWIDGQLEEPARSVVAEHVGLCERCALEAEEFAHLNRIYAGADEVAPNAGFSAAVLDRIRAAEEETSWPQWLAWLRPAPTPVFAGVVALLLVAAVTFWTSRAEARPAVITCRIEGMMCEQCDRQVHSILQGISGVDSVQLDVRTGRARMRLKRGGAVSLNELTRAVDQTRQYRITELEVINEGGKDKGGETK